MIELLEQVPIPTWLVTTMGVTSLLFLLFAGSFMPPLISRIPNDYFTRPPKPRTSCQHPLLLLLFMMIRNIVGIALLAAGLIMLFTPGQGVLTILAGFMISVFPGKRKIECWLATRKHVWRGLNWLRAKHGAAPLLHPGHEVTPPQ
jgi:uncharacterized membrane protein SpoIIM required for sporulation